MPDHEPSGLPEPTRREFLMTVGSTAAAAFITGCASVHHGETARTTMEPSKIEGALPITLRINGKDQHLQMPTKFVAADRFHVLIFSLSSD